MMVIIKIVKLKEKDNIIGKMVINMKANIKMVKEKEKEKCVIKMVKQKKVIEKDFENLWSIKVFIIPFILKYIIKKSI